MTKFGEGSRCSQSSDQQFADIPARSRWAFTKIAWPSPPKLVAGVAVALASFLILGTLGALWPNALFIRMTPITGFEPALLGIQSILLGAFVAIRRPACKLRSAGFSSVVNFLGVACPVCNKILLFVFGASALLTYFEPIRIYVAMLGVLLGLATVLVEMRKRRTNLIQMERNRSSAQT